MAAKVELENYVNNRHPYPEYISLHISSCCDTSTKQERLQLVTDGFPQDTAVKVNGYANDDTNTDTHPNDTTGIVLRFKFKLILMYVVFLFCLLLSLLCNVWFRLRKLWFLC